MSTRAPWSTPGDRRLVRAIGRNVHRPGVGNGGVLEPLQPTSTIIEDNCFIGARSEVVEGVIVVKTGTRNGCVHRPEHQDL
jgi:2,3,4,5-tetrahydropyridine-2-carboxylate N-succinyltransferase